MSDYMENAAGNEIRRIVRRWAAEKGDTEETRLVLSEFGIDEPEEPVSIGSAMELYQEYISEFEIIDGVTMHRDGLNFEQWKANRKR